ncbi:MAG: TPM domain-containing protein [Eubacteriales bacterium]
MNNESSNIPARRKTSAFSEFSVLSAGILTVVVALAVLAVLFYAFMMRPPVKTYALEDGADLLSKTEEKKIAGLAENLKDKKQINVIIVTTDDKGSGYVNDDEGSASFAADKYSELAHSQSFKDNSGVLILIDMQNRYVYVYTYATAHAAVSNDECLQMTANVSPLLTDAKYSSAVESLIEQISDNDFFSGALVMVYVLYIAGPLAIVAAAVLIAKNKKRNKITTAYNTYLDLSKTKDTGDQDIFDHKTVTVTTTSSSSGFSGGGGGFSGGGGHSGGGGSHF